MLETILNNSNIDIFFEKVNKFLNISFFMDLIKNYETSIF